MNTFLKSFYKLAGLAEVSTVAVLDGDKILMGKRRDNEKYTTPGGHLNPGEDPLEGAVRELFEESGIKADKNKLVHLKTEKVTTPKGKKLIIHAYKVSMPGVKTSMKNDPDQEVYRWNWINTAGGLPKDILEHLHSPKNVLLKALGLLDQEKSAMSPGKIHELAQSGLTKRMLERAIKFPHGNTTGGRSQWEAVDEAANMLATAKNKKPVMEAINRMYPKSEKVAKDISTPANELVKEHKHLVQVLKSPSHADDKVEAKKQEKELHEYEKEASMNNFWNGFVKEAVSKADLKEVLKKHEERETPEQEAAESEKEQEIERKAGVEKHAKEKPNEHHVRRFLLGNPISTAIETKKGKKLDQFGKAFGHQFVETLKGTVAGAGLGVAGGYAASALSKGKINPGEAAFVLGSAGANIGGSIGGLKGNHDSKASKIHAEHSKHAFAIGFEKQARKLSYKARANLPSGDFVFPKERKYPIHDKNHARNALARASGKPEEAKVRAAVHRKFPGIE